MSILLVLDNPKDWPLNIDGVDVVSARRYLTDPAFSDVARPLKVFNLCRSYKYQSLGYYVSLIAAARGHKPLPDISTIQDLKLSELIRSAGKDIDDEIQSGLRKLKAETFTLSIYFGQNIEEKYNRLALALFNQFPAPFLRAQFRHDGRSWILESIRTIAASEVRPTTSCSCSTAPPTTSTVRTASRARSSRATTLPSCMTRTSPSSPATRRR